MAAAVICRPESLPPVETGRAADRPRSRRDCCPARQAPRERSRKSSGSARSRSRRTEATLRRSPPTPRSRPQARGSPCADCVRADQARAPTANLTPRSRDAQLDQARPRLPIPVAIAVALGEPVSRSLAKACAGPRADLHLHQPLGGEGDHVARRRRPSPRARAGSSSRRSLGFLGCVETSNPTLPENRQWPPQAARSLQR